MKREKFVKSLLKELKNHSIYNQPVFDSLSDLFVIVNFSSFEGLSGSGNYYRITLKYKGIILDIQTTQFSYSPTIDISDFKFYDCENKEIKLDPEEEFLFSLNTIFKSFAKKLKGKK